MGGASPATIRPQFRGLIFLRKIMEQQTNLLTIEEQMGAEPEGGILSRTIARDEEANRYTSARLESQRPEIYNAAQMLLQAGYSTTDVASSLNLQWYTVNAIAAAKPEIVAAGKKIGGRLASQINRAAMDKVMEYIDTCSITSATDAKSIMVIAGIGKDIARDLDGDPTHIVKIDAPDLLDVTDYIAGLLPAQPVQTGTETGTKSGDAVIELGNGDDLAGDADALIDASRSVISQESGTKSDAVKQVIDNQGVAASDQLTTSQLEQDAAGSGEGIEVPGGGLGDRRGR